MIIKDCIWRTWVTILSNRTMAQKYQVKMSCPASGETPANITLKGKVYSVDEAKEDIILDRTGILDFTDGMSHNLGDYDEDAGPGLIVGINYKIIHE